LAIGGKISRLYRLRLAGPADRVLVARTWDEWHCAFGHLNMKSLRHLKTHNMVNGLEVHNEKADLHQCKACLASKSHIQPFPCESQRKYTEIGEMTYTDLFGKVDQKGPHGEHYFISFTDAAIIPLENFLWKCNMGYTLYSWISLLESTLETSYKPQT